MTTFASVKPVKEPAGSPTRAGDSEIRIFGIDPSLTATGYASVVDGEPEGGGVVKTKPDQFNERIDRCIYIVDTVCRTIQRNAPVALVAIEGYAFAGNRGHDLGELGGVLRYALRQIQMDFVEIPPGEWRKKVLGIGNIHKDDLRIAMLKRHGVEFSDLNTVEAYGVGLCAYLYLKEQSG